MARFDVYPGVREKGYLLDCQADLLSHLGTRVVVPLLPIAHVAPVSRLNPIFEIDGQQCLMSTQIIFAIPAAHLAAPVTSLDHEHDRIIEALDMLIRGY